MMDSDTNRRTLDPTLVSGEMTYWLLKPEQRLREHLKCYFVVDAARRVTCKEELLLPDGYAELVFMLSDGFDRTPLHEANATPMRRSYIIGARSHSVLTRDMGNMHVVGVKLDPRFLRQLIGVPLSELRDSTIEFRDINDPHLLELEDRIASCRHVEQIVAVLNDFFLGRLTSRPGNDGVVDDLLVHIRDHRGGICIGERADHYGIDARTLERRFAAWVGLSPKAYARIVRFKHAYHALMCSTSRRDGRHLDGYYDESHFHKEFRFFTGNSPSRFMGTHARTTEVTNHLLSGDLTAL